MKHIYIKIAALAVLFFMSSCSDDFLEQNPTDAISSSNATATTGNMQLVINGIHRLMYTRQGSNGRGGYPAMMLQMEALGDDYVMNARANGWFITMAQWQDPQNENDGDILFPWSVMYEAVNNANIVISGAAEAVGPDSERNAALAEAYCYRAFAFFHLVRLYAERYDPNGANTQLGIPIPTESTTEGLSRSSVADVYSQINSDLDQAIALLDGTTRTNKSHFDQSVAYGLKARVALEQGDYSTAAANAQAAQEGYNLMSMDDYQQGFNDFDNSEWMWGIHYNEEQGSAFTNYGAYISRNFSSSNIRGNPKSINSVLYDQIPTTDVRSMVFDPTGEHPNLPAGIEISSRHQRFPYTSQKFLSYSTGDSRGDVPFMRVAEMYLIEAEALAKAGDEAGAREALFTLASSRDPEYALSTNTGQDLIDEILLQRRWELWGEGFRFLDLKRLNLPLDRTGTNHSSSLLSNIMEIPAGDPRWIWQIPQSEINANPNMVQN